LVTRAAKREVFTKSLSLPLLVVIVGLTAYGSHEHQSTSVGQKPPAADECLSFESVMMGELVDQAGTKLGLRTVGRSETILGSTIFKAPNGVRLTAKSGEFGSPSQAKRYFDERLSRSLKILKWGTKKDKGGKTVGLRAEVLDPDSKVLTVVWSSGSWFHEISSSSLRDDLQLEKCLAD